MKGSWAEEEPSARAVSVGLPTALVKCWTGEVGQLSLSGSQWAGSLRS